MAPPPPTASSLTLLISSKTYPLCFYDAIALSAGSPASVAIVAATVDAVEVEVIVGIIGGGDGGGGRGGRCVHPNRCHRVKAAYSICRKGDDCGGGRLVAVVMVVDEGKDLLHDCDRGGDCGAGGRFGGWILRLDCF